MRVLLGFPQQDKQTGIYIKNGFEENNCDVILVHDPKIESPMILLKKAKELKPDLVFMSRSECYNSIIEDLHKLTLTAVWNIDVRNNPWAWNHLKPLMTYSHFWFTIAKGHVEEYRKAGINAFWLSEGCDKIHQLRSEGRTEEFDLFFAGSINSFHENYGKRVSVLNAIKDKNYNCYISNGLKLINKEHNDYVGRSQISLGNSAFPQVELSMSARDYRIMGASGFLLTNYVKGIETWFKIGEECDTYSSPKEAVEKLAYYCTHKTQRIKIEKCGYKVAHLKHRFKNRIEEIINIANKF